MAGCGRTPPTILWVRLWRFWSSAVPLSKQQRCAGSFNNHTLWRSMPVSCIRCWWISAASCIGGLDAKVRRSCPLWIKGSHGSTATDVRHWLLCGQSQQLWHLGDARDAQQLCLGTTKWYYDSDPIQDPKWWPRGFRGWFEACLMVGFVLFHAHWDW